MLLSFCSAAPASSSHFQASFHTNSSESLRKAVVDANVCLKDGIHAQDVSFKTHATKSIHSIVIETPNSSASPDSAIFSPYSNKFDDIVRGFPNEMLDNQPETFTCSVGEATGMNSFDRNLIYVDNAYGTTNTVPVTEVTNSSINVKDSVDTFLSKATETVDKAQDALKSSYNTIVSSLNEAVDNVKDYVDDATNGLFSSVSESKEQASNEITGLSVRLKENIFKTGSVAINILRSVIVMVEDTLSNATTLVGYSYGSLKSLLPPDIKDAINLSEVKIIQILNPVGDAIHQVYIIIEGFEKKLGLDPSDPVVPFLLILGSSATLGISYWSFTYGGYSGDLDPETTLELLKNEKDALLIDVRPEDARERDGVPDLRRAARFKYASVTLPELDTALRKQLKGGKDIDNALVAVVIRNLKLMKNGSKVIVMDSGGERSKAIARSLKKLGVKNSYLVYGGYKSWVSKGLRVKELKPETALTILNEEAEAILENIKPTPTLVIGYGLGFLAVSYSFLEWEKTLQYIAIFGLVLTIYQRFSSYENSEDLKQDVRLLLAPVSFGAQAVSWAASKLEPNRIGLATSPSSTSVQDRVLKAAAKHESQPSDESETSIQTVDNLTSSTES